MNMKYQIIRLSETNSVGIGFDDKGNTFLRFERDNTFHEEKPTTCEIVANEDSIVTRLHLSEPATKALTELLNRATITHI